MPWRNSNLISKQAPSLLKNSINNVWFRSQPKSSLTPIGGGFGDLFKMKTIKENWECIPIFVCGFAAALLPIISSALRFMNSEDVRFKAGSKMKNQKHAWILEGPPKPNKYIVINQKWVWPEGLLKALREDGDEDNGADKKTPPKGTKRAMQCN